MTPWSKRTSGNARNDTHAETGMTPAITIQPFTADHAGMPFTCGVRRIDDYFSQGAHIQKERLARLFVALDRPTRRTALGFYALHNMDIEADVVPPPLGAKL